MSLAIEYIIVGGPQHGLICPHPSPDVEAGSFAIVSRDGQLCRAAARRHSGPNRERMILLHPLATGEQFRTMLAA